MRPNFFLNLLETFFIPKALSQCKVLDRIAGLKGLASFPTKSLPGFFLKRLGFFGSASTAHFSPQKKHQTLNSNASSDPLRTFFGVISSLSEQFFFLSVFRSFH